MFLANYLNRNYTDPLFPLFDILYAVELVILTFAILLGIAVLSRVWYIRFHRNIRLRVFCSTLHGLIYPLSRIIMIYHEYFGPIDNTEYLYLIICSQIKFQFLSYFTTLISILAIDRVVATKYWAWYERGGWDTLLFFVAQEIVLTVVGNIVGAALVLDYIDDLQFTYYFVGIVPFGTSIFIASYLFNRKEMVKMKRGAVIHRYSVAKTFQFKENIRLLELFVKIAKPLIVTFIPPFIFYPIYSLVPKGIGYDELRYISVTIYEVGLSIACVVVIGSLMFYEPALRIQIFCCPRRKKEVHSIAPSNVDLTDAYFAMFSSQIK